MLHKRLAILLGICFLPVLLLIFAVMQGRGGSIPPAIASDVNFQLPQPDNPNEIDAPTITSIASPSPTCSRPRPGTGACYIQWSYMSVTAASSSYIISMTVAIDNQIRAHHSGFFQTAMYIPSDMMGDGYKVVCGFPQGSTGFGNSYSYAIRARETSGQVAANFGSVTCPGDIAKIYLPAVLKP